MKDENLYSFVHVIVDYVDAIVDYFVVADDVDFEQTSFFLRFAFPVVQKVCRWYLHIYIYIDVGEVVVVCRRRETEPFMDVRSCTDNSYFSPTDIISTQLVFALPLLRLTSLFVSNKPRRLERGARNKLFLLDCLQYVDDHSTFIPV